jgi:hypothetical protein
VSPTYAANAAFGSGSYSYSWAKTSGNGTLVGGPNASTQEITASSGNTNSPLPFTIQCTVTDNVTGQQLTVFYSSDFIFSTNQ